MHMHIALQFSIWMCISCLHTSHTRNLVRLFYFTERSRTHSTFNVYYYYYSIEAHCAPPRWTQFQAWLFRFFVFRLRWCACSFPHYHCASTGAELKRNTFLLFLWHFHKTVLNFSTYSTSNFCRCKWHQMLLIGRSSHSIHSQFTWNFE